MKMKLCQGVWKDKAGNTLIFFQEQKKLFLCVDGNDCTEGVEEEIDCCVSTIIEVLKWYGYQELASHFENWAIENNFNHN